MQRHTYLAKIQIIFSLALISICCLISSANAQFSTDTLINDDGSAFEQSIRNGVPSIAINGSTVYATWLDARAGATISNTLGYDVYFAKGTLDSTGKITFGPNIKVNDTNQSVYHGDTAASSMAVASDGTIFIVWKDNRDETNGSDNQGNSIYLARSLDGGTSFQANQKIDVLPTTEVYLHRRSPRVAAADGYVYVTFGKGSSEALEMSISSDNGSTFGSVKKILPLSADESVITASGSYVYVASLVGTSMGVGQASKDDVILYVSSDHGQSFGSAIQINDDGMDKQPDDITIAASGSNLYLAWQDNRNVVSGVPGGYYIYGAVSNDYGATFGANVMLSPELSSIANSSDDNRNEPSLSASGDYVAISFHGVVNAYQSVISLISSDKGSTWTSEMVVSDNLSRPSIGPSSIAVNSSSACVMWQADGKYIGNTGTGNNMYAAGYTAPAAPAIAVGAGAGANVIATINVTDTYDVSLTTTNAAGATPTQEWIAYQAIVSGTTSGWCFMTPTGSVQYTAGMDLATVQYPTAGAGTLAIGQFKLGTFMQNVGDKLVLAYVYSTTSMDLADPTSYVVENVVTMTVK